MQLREEHAAVLQQHGLDLTPAAISAMPYTSAVAKETVRLARIVPGVVRKATKDIQTNNTSAPTITSGCPFIIATGAISVQDPAVAGDSEEFKPERWLDSKTAKLLSVN